MTKAATGKRGSADSSSPMRRHLFYETTHSPALTDLVGYENARNIIDFCFIANPYYPTDAMLRDMQLNLPNLIKSYPSSNPFIGQRHLAEVLHVKPENLLIGNGATELITLLETRVVERIAVPVPTFGEYIEKMKDQSDAELYPLNPDDQYQLRLGDYLGWIRKRDLRSLLIINPGNPTGQFIALDEMVAFLRETKDMDLVVVDESFIDFSGDPVPSLLGVANQFPNLLIMRSISKHCGVPGLRLGYCYSANLEILSRLRRFIPTWNLNTLAQYFLSLLASTDAAYHEARKRVIDDVGRLYSALKTIPKVTVYPTGANFVLLKVENGATATELQMRLLREHQMYVRDCSNKVGMDNFHIRVASQGREKDAKFVEALQAVMR